jgi:hypothetical protein
MQLKVHDCAHVVLLVVEGDGQRLAATQAVAVITSADETAGCALEGAGPQVCHAGRCDDDHHLVLSKVEPQGSAGPNVRVTRHVD